MTLRSRSTTLRSRSPPVISVLMTVTLLGTRVSYDRAI